MRVLPKSLAGRMIALLLLALIGAQAIGIMVFLDERQHFARTAAHQQVMARTIATVRLLNRTPPELGPRIAESVSGPGLRFWIADESAIEPSDPAARGHPLYRMFNMMLAGAGAGEALIRVESGGASGPLAWLIPDWVESRFGGGETDREQGNDDGGKDNRETGYGHMRDHMGQHGMPARWRRPLSLTIAVPLADGRWLNAETGSVSRPPAWAWSSLILLGAMATAITAIVIFSMRRVARPLRALAGAAESLGRGEAVTPLAEEGPEDVRRTTRAFNEMGARLQRYMDDRMRMLAAISHDLRTPITTLRLRAEFIDEPEVRDKMLETLAEMQHMTEAVLAFAREDAAREDTRPVELKALVESLCEDLADSGLNVTVIKADSVTYACRAVGLKRALANLIENAVAYGGAARVTLRDAGPDIRVTVDDDGPGIPEAQMEQAFEPFVRLESSRSRETGGAGLGLAIARSIAHGHEGDITLANRSEGGLRATMTLPKSKDR